MRLFWVSSLFSTVPCVWSFLPISPFQQQQQQQQQQSPRTAVFVGVVVPHNYNRNSWLLFATADEQQQQQQQQRQQQQVSTNNDAENAELQKIFLKYCSNGSTMSQSDMTRIDWIEELLQEGDLLMEELQEIWSTYAVEEQQEEVDLNTFSKIYRAVDDLFEQDDDGVDETDDQINTKYDRLEDVDEPQPPPAAQSSSSTATATTMTTTSSTTTDTETPSSASSSSSSTLLLFEENNAQAVSELQEIFKVISDSNGLITKQQLKAWDEIETLLMEGMLGADEFEELWDATCAPSDNNKQQLLDWQGFILFNSKLDELFDFETEEEDNNNSSNNDTIVTSLEDKNNPQEQKETQADVSSSATTDSDDDVSLFQSLLVGTGASADAIITRNDLSGWKDLQEMLADEDLLPEELDQMYQSALAQSKNPLGLDQDAFRFLCTAIDELFEYVDEVEEDNDDNKKSSLSSDEKTQESSTTTTAAAAMVDADASGQSIKNDLLQALAVISDRSSDDGKERLPCGLECTEREEKLILNLANELIAHQDANILYQRNIETKDVAGKWKLLYTSSSAMKFNKGLSGIGGSFPNGKFGGLIQTLSGSSLLPDVEYKERINVTPSSASFDVTVNGYWELRQSMSLFTGEKSIVVAIEPNRVTYGPTSTKADHWKSLGPTNQLDLVYLDTDLRIMRGSTSMDTILIFQRI